VRLLCRAHTRVRAVAAEKDEALVEVERLRRQVKELQQLLLGVRTELHRDGAAILSEFGVHSVSARGRAAGSAVLGAAAASVAGVSGTTAARPFESDSGFDRRLSSDGEGEGEGDADGDAPLQAHPARFLCEELERGGF
jgi:hypothetical protein